MAQEGFIFGAAWRKLFFAAATLWHWMLWLFPIHFPSF